MLTNEDMLTLVKASNSTLVGVVDVFAADLKCELGELTLQSVSTIFCSVRECPQFNFIVNSPSCHAADVSLIGPIYDYQSVTRYAGSIQPATCSNLSPANDPNRMILSLGRLSYVKKANDIDNPDYHLQESISLVCKPTYSISRALVSAYSDTASNGSAWNVAAPSGAASVQLAHVSGWDIAQGVLSSAESVAYTGEQFQGLGTQLIWTVGLQDTDQSSYRLDTFFAILCGHMPPDISDWFDVDALNTTSRHLYVSFAAQVAKQFLMVSAQESFIGTSFANENRLFVRVLSFGFMEALLVLLVVLAVLKLFWASKGVVTRDPGSVAGLVTILTQSPEFVASMQDTGPLDVRAIADRIRGHGYSIETGIGDWQPPFGIKTSSLRNCKEVSSTLESGQACRLKWWQPLALTLPARLLSLALLVALIVALELLYQHSQRHNGLVDVPVDDYSHYGWTYIPAFIMLSTGFLVSMVDFSAKIYQPYHALRNGAVPASRSILENPLGNIAIRGLWSAMRKRHYAIIATTLAMLLAPVLTIAVSGLYTAGSYELPVTVQPLSYFNFSSAESGGELMPGASLPVTNLLVENSLSFPSWTFNDLVLPKLKMDSANVSTNGTLSSLSTQIPAVRGTLKCIQIPAQDLVHANLSNSNGSSMLAFNLSTPDGCGNNCYNDDNTMKFCAPGSIGLPPGGGYFGSLFDGILGGANGRSNQIPVCPSKLAVWGMSSASKLEDITMAACYETIEQVSTNVTFQLPAYTISPSLPPLVIKSTAVNLTPLPEVILIDVSDALTTLNSSGELFDSFFSALVHGGNPLPVTYLATSSMLPEVTTAIGRLYGIVTAQSINIAYRFAFNSSTDTSAVNPAERGNFSGTLLNPNPVRLRQNAISTRILEGVLAMIFLCTALAFILLDTRRVLPKNPCSIAAVASLLAGSEMLGKGIIPDGAEWCDDEELRRRGVFEGYLFSMGWWADKHGERRRFGIDVGRADAEKPEKRLPFVKLRRKLF